MTVGASGCVHGFLAACAMDGAAAALLPWARRPRGTGGGLVPGWVVLWGVVRHFQGPVSDVAAAVGRIDNWAHLGGTVGGFAVCAAKKRGSGLSGGRRLRCAGRMMRVLAVLVALGGAKFGSARWVLG
eukprot:Skav216984  [mRNA]  locus=scaffold594:186093:189407:- [translate_table: standard]